jgi:hypothetical protein
MVQEELPPHEVVAVAQEEALAIDGKATEAIPARVMLQEVPATLALKGAVDPSNGGKASPSLAQTSGDLSARGGT